MSVVEEAVVFMTIMIIIEIEFTQIEAVLLKQCCQVDR